MIELNPPRERERSNGPDIGRAVAIVVFCSLIVLNVASLRNRSFDGVSSLAVWTASLLTLAFYVVLTVAYFRRSRAQATDRDWRAWAVALLGTSAPFLFPLLATGRVSSQAQNIAASALLIVGLSLMIWSLSYLGTNISVVPQARAVVTTGPYSYVRHPLYSAELVNVVGICLSLKGVLPWLLLAAWILLQVMRARNEEALLLTTLSGYAEYQRTTPMLIPDRLLGGAHARAARAPRTLHDRPDDV